MLHGTAYFVMLRSETLTTSLPFLPKCCQQDFALQCELQENCTSSLSLNIAINVRMFFSDNVTSTPVELGFLFDGSGQISHQDFVAQIDIAKQIVDTFNISDELARVGAAIFSPLSRVLFTFDDPLSGPNRTKQAVKQLLDKTPHDQGAARLGSGLQTVDSDLFSPEGGSADAPKVSSPPNTTQHLFSF